MTLAQMGACVTVTGRDEKRGVEDIAEAWLRSGQKLDVLIHNAGLMASRRELNADGIETGFAVNVVAPLRLTHALKQALSSHARIVAVTGGEHPSSLQFDNLQGERHFVALNQYSHHKLVMMATMRELARRWTGTGGSINVCYPGQAATTMTQSVKAADMPLAMRWLFPIFKWMTREDGGKSAIKAARSTVYLASSDVVESITGQYFDSKCRSKAWPKAIRDEAICLKAWELVHAQGFLSSH